MNNNNTGYYWNQNFLGHQNSKMHPENASRAEVLNPKYFTGDLTNSKIVSSTNINGLQWLKEVHDKEFISHVESSYRERRLCMEGGAIGQTKVHTDTYNVSLEAIQGSLEIVNQVLNNKIKNGFSACRPPGHHAGASTAKGFCYFNNIAVCARYAQVKFNLKNILIIDWDVHPGDGTVSIFYEDPNIHVLNLFQKGIFGVAYTPNSIGRNEGEGTSWNYPLDQNISESEYLKTFSNKLDTVLSRCNPELILISAGFDMHIADPLGAMRMNHETFSKLTKEVMQAAKTYCKGKIVSLLEGGYNHNALQKCVHSHINALLT